MPQRNRSTANVHLRGIDPEDVGTVDRHGCKGFVELDDVDVSLEVEVVFGEELGYCEGGTDTHDSRGDAGDCGADEFGEDGLVGGVRF